MIFSTETGEATNSLGVREGPVGEGKWPKRPPMKGDSLLGTDDPLHGGG